MSPGMNELKGKQQQIRGAVHIEHIFESHLELKSREISFEHNIRLINPIVLNICTEHDSITAVRYVQF